MPEYVDVSDYTDNAVGGDRVLRRRGIVIHTTEGTNSLAWLQGMSARDGRPASADFLIDRKGNIFQLTRPGRFAYHSGQSRHGLYQEPDHTISQGYYGIELEQYLKLDQKVTDAQYISLAFLVRTLITAAYIDVRNIVGHYQVALPQGRKMDPTGFDWPIFTVEMIYPSPEWKDYMFKGELP